MIITQNGKIIRLESDQIRQAGRSTQGVRVVRMEEGDKVAAACLVPESEVEDEKGSRTTAAIALGRVIAFRGPGNKSGPNFLHQAAVVGPRKALARLRLALPLLLYRWFIELGWEISCVGSIRISQPLLSAAVRVERHLHAACIF